jgi:hypothetical protein
MNSLSIIITQQKNYPSIDSNVCFKIIFNKKNSISKKRLTLLFRKIQII